MSTTTMTGAGVGASCCIETNDAGLIKFLDELPSRPAYATEWAVRSGERDGTVSFEVSDEAAKSDPVQTAVKGAPIPKPPTPGADDLPRDPDMRVYRESSPRS
jgi:hypothetical protein